MSDSEIIKGLLNVIDSIKGELDSTKTELQKTKELLEEAHDQNLAMTQEIAELKNMLSDAEMIHQLVVLNERTQLELVETRKKLEKTKELLETSHCQNLELTEEVYALKQDERIPWAMDRITEAKGNIVVDNKMLLSKEKLTVMVKNRPWIAFPDMYEVECHNSHCLASIPLNVMREDGVSVLCENCLCDTIVETAEHPKTWVYFGTCDHFCSSMRTPNTYFVFSWLRQSRSPTTRDG